MRTGTYHQMRKKVKFPKQQPRNEEKLKNPYKNQKHRRFQKKIESIICPFPGWVNFIAVLIVEDFKRKLKDIYCSRAVYKHIKFNNEDFKRKLKVLRHTYSRSWSVQGWFQKKIESICVILPVQHPNQREMISKENWKGIHDYVVSALLQAIWWFQKKIESRLALLMYAIFTMWDDFKRKLKACLPHPQQPPLSL